MIEWQSCIHTLVLLSVKIVLYFLLSFVRAQELVFKPGPHPVMFSLHYPTTSIQLGVDSGGSILGSSGSWVEGISQ